MVLDLICRSGVWCIRFVWRKYRGKYLLNLKSMWQLWQLWQKVTKQKSIEEAYKEWVQLWRFAPILDLLLLDYTGTRERIKIYLDKDALKPLVKGTGFCCKMETFFFLNARLEMKFVTLETNWGTTQTNMSGCDLNEGGEGETGLDGT